MTALMTACATGNVENVRWLRLFGADVELRDGRGWTASQLADDADARRVADAVWCMFALGKSRPKLLFDAMEAAIEDDDLEELRELLALDGADANAGSEQGMTLLHLACHGSVERGRHASPRRRGVRASSSRKGRTTSTIKDRNGHRSATTRRRTDCVLCRAAPRAGRRSRRGAICRRARLPML